MFLRRCRTLITLPAVHLPARGDGTPSALSFAAAAVALISEVSARSGAIGLGARLGRCLATFYSPGSTAATEAPIFALARAKPDAASLGRSQRRLCPFRDQLTLALRQRRINVERERIRIRAQFGDDEVHTLRHQPGDERDIA